MHDETGFLNAIRQNPADDVARLVFADWLDERDEPTARTKSEFIRLELRMAAAPEKSLNRVRRVKKLEKLAAQLESQWLALVSHPKLEACRVSFHFACPQRWELLTATDDENVRACEACSRPVHFCNTIQEARCHAALGNCVAVSPALARKPDDLVSPPMFVIAGMPMLPLPPGATSVLGSLSVAETELEPLQPQWEPTALKGKGRRVRARRNVRPRNIQREPWEDE